MSRTAGLLGFALLFVSLHSPAWGLFDNEDFSTLKFNLVNPGARATALGGAFTGLADDASAAVSNPAGLVILGSPELTYEHKFFSFHHRVPFFRAEVPDAFIAADFTDETQGPSFVSFVWPTKQVTLALYRYESANFEQNFRTEDLQSTFRDEIGTAFPTKSSLEMLISNIGLAAGVKLHPRLSIGAGIEFSRLDFNSILDRFDPGSARRLADLAERVVVDTEDEAFGFRFGALWNPWETLNVGLLISRGPRFKGQGGKLVTESVEGGEPRLRSAADRPFVLKVPDVFRLGASYKLFQGRLTLTADLEYVKYSQLLEGFETIFHGSDPKNFDVDDAIAWHLGVEAVVYVAPDPERAVLTNFSLRAGFATDPDHQIKAIKEPTNLNERADQVLFPGGEDERVFSLGSAPSSSGGSSRIRPLATRRTRATPRASPSCIGSDGGKDSEARTPLAPLEGWGQSGG